MKRRSLLGLGGGISAALLLPSASGASASAEPLTAAQRAELAEYADRTWASMTAMTDPVSGLAADNIDGDLTGGSRAAYTSPTNIGCYLWSAICARELDILSAKETRGRIRTTLDTLAELERHEHSGMFYNWYDPISGELLLEWPDDGSEIHPFLSSVDNAWLAAALMTVAADDERLRERAEAILAEMNFGFYYDPAARGADFGAGLLRGGFWPRQPPEGGVKDNYPGHGPDVWYTDHHYGTLNSETRMISYVAIGLGQVPPEHYFAVWRTHEPDCDWSWQEMKPVGEYTTHLGIEVYEGAYRYRDLQLVPSWGGSMFEALMPDLFVPEAEWGPRNWGRNHPAFVKGQIQHGLDEADYGHWGFSPASDPFAQYREYGVDAMGMDADGYASDVERTTVDYGFAGCEGREPQPEPTEYGDGVVTPHAVFLALPYAPKPAMAELMRLRDDFDIYGPGGFRDAVAVRSGTVASRYLALDQGMIMAALGNLLADQAIRRRFSGGAVRRALKPLLSMEEFNVPARQ